MRRIKLATVVAARLLTLLVQCSIALAALVVVLLLIPAGIALSMFCDLAVCMIALSTGTLGRLRGGNETKKIFIT